MAVQINEVIIKAVVDPRPDTRSKGSTNPPDCPPATAGDRDNELAEKILEILREKKER
ncbi:MAG TPA: DUF5908 family protein [Chitinophaga sp.]|jgi:hypothetical protein|uniref:DUF5908 family protein n=1 Tax=Chitinophaga sp. TaxID=1869181 RepID=UPI002DBCEFD0|nr:DUF5908 family protein [Chitinophaga sp.]HEU4553919.1 DUF5908 family protein [Chitinophaga sp.]